jgi:CRISPR-associated protein Csd1
MILQALARYYDILSNDPDSDIAPPGYGAVGVSYALNISAKGELLDVFPLFDQVQRGKKTEEKPHRMIVPEQVKRSMNVSANYLWDSCVYVLGLSDKEAKDPKYAVKRFEAFRRWNSEMLGKADCSAAKAVIAFLKNYDPESGKKHPKIATHLETILKGGNLVFMFNGSCVHEDPVIRKAWEMYKSGSDAVLSQCLVTGEIAPVARLHPSLKGIRDANPTGATLVGFNASAYESYNRGQGMNSPVSEKAAFAYTTALNYLLSSTNENKKFTIGDTTVVYWAESEKKEYARAFMGLCEPEMVEVAAKAEEAGEPVRDKKAEKRLKKVAEKVKRVQALDVKRLLEGLDENPRFYVLGLAPNAARVSVRFFHSDPFDKIVEKIMKYYKDLEIVKEFDNQPTYITVRHILAETISPKATNPEASPLMAGAMFRSILTSAPYPAALYYAILNRIRADMDDSQKGIRKINYVRAAVIKAFLIRKYRNQPQHPIQEVLSMSLNEQSTIPAYVLGRLFAVLEKVQQEAIGDVNASIKDRYFTSACASPASVFPVLLRLSQHHISKAEYGRARDNRIEAILNLLDVEKNPIPPHLSLDDQGIFVLGYYHERKDLWTSKSKKSAESTSSEN